LCGQRGAHAAHIYPRNLPFSRFEDFAITTLPLSLLDPGDVHVRRSCAEGTDNGSDGW